MQLFTFFLFSPISGVNSNEVEFSVTPIGCWELLSWVNGCYSEGTSFYAINGLLWIDCSYPWLLAIADIVEVCGSACRWAF